MTATEPGPIPADVTLKDANGYSTAAIAAPKLTATAPTLDISEAVIAWENDTITRAEAAKLTVTVPVKVTAVTVGGEEITLFTLTEDGTKVFTCEITPENAGHYQYTVVLSEMYGYTSDTALTPVLTVNEPAPAADDPADPGNAGGEGTEEGRRCAFYDLLQAILNFFRKVVGFFKIKA